jgi:glucosamine--fructose-6-phosphate aminotransferase (isomerizing)
LFEIHLGVPVVLAAPSVVTKYGANLRYPKSLVIGISQSGAGPDVSEVLGQLRRQGHLTLAVTNTAGSRLTQEAEHTILLDAGTEHAVAATKSYLTSLLALHEIVRAAGGNLDAPQTPTAEWVESCRAAAEHDLGALLRSSLSFSLARGYNFCTAHETALKMVECALLPCKAYSTADFAHGPKALATHGTAAIVYGETPENLAETGTLILQAPQSDKGTSAPMWDVIYGQWLALLAARARGLDPDRPVGLSKVTMTL